MQRLTILLTLLLCSACGTTLRTIPMPNPATGMQPGAEYRQPNDNARLQRDCAEQGAHDCLDVFWRLEYAGPQEVVFRYRILASSPEEARAQMSYINRIEMVTEDGRTVQPRLHDRFTVEQLRPITYWTDGRVGTGRTVYRRQADGSVIAEEETVRGEVRRTLERYSGSNYVVFEGPSLVTPQSQFVKFRFSGLLGSTEWTFVFSPVAPVNAQIATQREPARSL